MQEEDNVTLAPAETPCGASTDEALKPSAPDGSLQKVSVVEDDEVDVSNTMRGEAEDKVLAGETSTGESDLPPPNRGLAGLSFSHVTVEEFASMPGEPDDDDVEPIMATPLVSLGHGRENFVNEDPHDDSVVGLGMSTGDPDPSSRARDLISRDLLNELSHEPNDWNEGHSSPTPPLRGFETPSDPGTPSPREVTQQPSYHSNHNHEGLMSIDQWDWKTDAPEFVPGSMKGLMGQTDTQVVSHTYAQQGAWAMQPSPALSGDRQGLMNSSSGDSSRPSELKANYEWQLRTKSEEVQELQHRMNQLEIETAQVRASWEVERRSLVRQIGHYRAVLERYCIPVDEAGTGYNLEDTQSHYFPVFEPSAPSQWTSTNASGNTSGATSGNFDPAARQSNFGASSFQPVPAPVNNEGSYGTQQRHGLYGSGSANTTAVTDGTGSGGQVNNSLDSKMRQLSSLLQEGNVSSCRNGNQTLESEGHEGSGYSGGFIASTLRAMFPHATIRTKAAPGEEGEEDEIAEEDFEAVENRGNDLQRPAKLMDSSRHAEKQRTGDADLIPQIVETLEKATGGHVDDRAMKSLHSLIVKDQLEALESTGHLVDKQGGSCRNLSSILQSVCRKLEKRREDLKGRRPGRHADNGRDPLNENGNRARDGPGRSTRRARRVDDDEHDAFDSSQSEGDQDVKGAGAHNTSWPHEFERAALRANAKAAREAERERNIGSKELPREAPIPEGAGTPISRRSAAGSKSWADIEDGDDDDKEDGRTRARPEDANDAWTPSLVDKLARNGFDLHRRGNHWELKIVMSQLDPPLTETGMERYCQWLRTRLTSFRDEHGADALWHCRGEIDFSQNHMSNQMVWTLLETLAQHEVHTALIKLYANRISQGGVLAICEFIRMNERADAVQELHLSHNEIDDESALELLRTLKAQRPKYPPRRMAEGSGEIVLAPVWLRLNHNKIHDPAAVLRMAEEEGVTVCTAWDRQVCGTSKCVRQDCPLAHLYAFTVQDLPKQQEKYDENGEGSGRRRDRRRDYGDRRRHDRRDSRDAP